MGTDISNNSIRLLSCIVEGDWKATPKPDGISNTRSRSALLSSKSVRSLKTKSIAESLVHIDDHAWAEDEFSPDEYAEANAFIENVESTLELRLTLTRRLNILLKT